MQGTIPIGAFDPVIITTATFLDSFRACPADFSTCVFGVHPPPDLFQLDVGPLRGNVVFRFSNSSLGYNLNEAAFTATPEPGGGVLLGLTFGAGCAWRVVRRRFVGHRDAITDGQDLFLKFKEPR